MSDKPAASAAVEWRKHWPVVAVVALGLAVRAKFGGIARAANHRRGEGP